MPTSRREKHRPPHRFAAALVALALAATVAPSAAQTPPGTAKPSRIVSLHMCMDDLLLRLVKPERIASVTWLSHDPRNANLFELARRIPKNYGLAEEVIPLDPDLVVAGTFSARTAVALIKRTPIRLVEFDTPRSFDEVRRQIRDVAAAVGEPDDGERIVRQLDERLATISAAKGPRPRAIVLNPNGATVGRGTLVGDVMMRAGLDNVAAELGIDSYGTVPLEHIVLNSVDILIVSTARDGPPALATEILHHPVLSRMSRRVKIVSVPSRLWNCGGPATVEAVERLRVVVDAFQRERATQ